MDNDESAHTRRTVLAGAGAAISTGLAGCSNVVGYARTSNPVSVLAAGSLSLALRDGFSSRLEIPLELEAHGSVAVTRMVAEGQRDPDIVAVADPELFQSILDVGWFAEFASNELVVAVNTDTEQGQRIAESDAWYRPIVAGDASVGRTDPDLDPLGYRTLFMLRLAERYYDNQGLAAKFLRRRQIYPETGLLSNFESGGLDAAIVYRNMAEERGYDYLNLPEQIDLSTPQYAENWYSTVSYSLPEDRTVTGGVISYGATIRDGHLSERTSHVFDRLTTGSYLAEFGFNTPSMYPTYTKNAPEQLT